MALECVGLAMTAKQTGVPAFHQKEIKAKDGTLIGVLQVYKYRASVISSSKSDIKLSARMI